MRVALVGHKKRFVYKRCRKKLKPFYLLNIIFVGLLVIDTKPCVVVTCLSFMLLQDSAKHHAVYMISSVASSLFGSVRVSSKGRFVELVTLLAEVTRKT